MKTVSFICDRCATEITVGAPSDKHLVVYKLDADGALYVGIPDELHFHYRCVNATEPEARGDAPE